MVLDHLLRLILCLLELLEFQLFQTYACHLSMIFGLEKGLKCIYTCLGVVISKKAWKLS